MALREWTLECSVFLDPSHSSPAAEAVPQQIVMLSGGDGSSLQLGFEQLRPFVEFRAAPTDEPVRVVSPHALELVLGEWSSITRDVWRTFAVSFQGTRLRIYVDGYEVAEQRLKQRPALRLVPASKLTLFDNRVDGRRALSGAIHRLTIQDRALAPNVLQARAKDRTGLPNDNLRRAVRDGYFLATSDPLQARIDHAIDGGVRWLSERQRASGEFPPEDDAAENYGYPVGWTALATLALLHAGVPANDPRIERAMAFLRAADPPEKTYEASVLLMSVAELRNDQDASWLQELTTRLVSFEHRVRGQWGYPLHTPDLSNTQFAVLALFAAHGRGVEIPSGIWKRVAKTVLKRFQARADKFVTEDRRGRERKVEFQGFGYHPRVDASISMTAAALAVFNIVQRMDESLERPSYGLGPAQESAMGWLAQRYDVSDLSASAYALYSVERVGALFGTRDLEGRDWYREGAAKLVGQQWETGAFSHAFQDTCFALLFLNRSTHQIVNDGPLTGQAALAALEQMSGPVHFRVSGQRRAILAVTGLEESLESSGLRPFRARWYFDGVLAREVGGKAGDPVSDPAFATRCSLPPDSTTSVHVEVDCLAVGGGVETVESSSLSVIR